MFDFDIELAQRHGEFNSYTSESSPTMVEYYGENPTIEMDRLLEHYATSEGYVLDIGCGAGQTLCRLAPRVKDIWGIDLNKELLQAARLRAIHLGTTNATIVHGDVADSEVLKQLPETAFNLAYSRRGPNINAFLLRTLRPEAVVIQEVVSDFDGYPLREIFGRRHYAPYFDTDQEVLLSRYADLGLSPVSCKEYFFDEFFRDREHLATFLKQVWAMLSDWRLPRRPYDPECDRSALDLYVRYNMTPYGIRVLRQRKIFVLRRATVAYYPVDTVMSSPL